MSAVRNLSSHIVGHHVPAEVGTRLEDIATPALIIDLDSFEFNVRTLKDFVERHEIRLRAHAKTHKSVDIAQYQILHGGACGICCQTVSEAEAMVVGGIRDVLLTNQVVDPAKIDRLAVLAKRARIIVCVDDASNVDDLANSATGHNVELECLVEIDVGAGRCGLSPGSPAVQLAAMIAAKRGLKFAGLQAYHGPAQHMQDFEDRRATIDLAAGFVVDTQRMLKAEGLHCDIVGGGGTGSYPFETASTVYNELQCGSYIFMDVAYGRLRNSEGIINSVFRNSLFVITSIISHAKQHIAICDAGHKTHSVDSGLPGVFGRDDLDCVKCSDEHGFIADSNGTLKLNDKLMLIPGHCDPTCNLHDWYVAVRSGRVEALWPVTARGLSA